MASFVQSHPPHGRTVAARLRAAFLSPLPTLDVALYCLFVILWGSALFMLSARWVFGLLPVSMLHSTGTTQLDLINRYAPYRLIQPEWLGKAPDDLHLIIHWSFAETLARLSVLGMVTLVLAWLTQRSLKRLDRCV